MPLCDVLGGAPPKPLNAVNQQMVTILGGLDNPIIQGVRGVDSGCRRPMPVEPMPVELAEETVYVLEGEAWTAEDEMFLPVVFQDPAVAPIGSPAPLPRPLAAPLPRPLPAPLPTANELTETGM